MLAWTRCISDPDSTLLVAINLDREPAVLPLGDLAGIVELSTELSEEGKSVSKQLSLAGSQGTILRIG